MLTLARALGASLEAAMAPAARPDCAMQPVRGVPSNVSSQSYIGCPPGFRVDEATRLQSDGQVRSVHKLWRYP